MDRAILSRAAYYILGVCIATSTFSCAGMQFVCKNQHGSQIKQCDNNSPIEGYWPTENYWPQDDGNGNCKSNPDCDIGK